MHEGEADRDGVVSVASAVSCAIRIGDILFDQKGFDGWRSSLGH